VKNGEEKPLKELTLRRLVKKKKKKIGNLASELCGLTVMHVT
jgi:hypothetical protein